MPEGQVEQAEIQLPDFGPLTVEPHIQPTEYQSRLGAALHRATERGLDILLIYAER